MEYLRVSVKITVAGICVDSMSHLNFVLKIRFLRVIRVPRGNGTPSETIGQLKVFG